MSSLQLLWLGSAVAAVAFFGAGMLVARVRRPSADGGQQGLPARLSEAQRETAAALAGQHAARSELEAARAAAAALTQKLAQAEGALTAARANRPAPPPTSIDRAIELERQLLERTGQLREVGSQLELLRSRAGEAEALRAECVRLRTQANETEYLSKEVERLSAALHSARSAALGGTARSRRPTPAAQPASGSTADALAGAISRFSDPQTHGIAVADAKGFPISAQGEDGVELAAYAALLAEAAGRAQKLLPMAAPISVEVVDERGARVAVWPFEVGGDALLLVRLSVAATEQERIDAALSEVSSILAPAPLESAG